MAELIKLSSSVQPTDRFKGFDYAKIIRLSEIYSEDVSDIDLMGFEAYLPSFKSIFSVHLDFQNDVKSIADLLSVIITSGLDKKLPLYSRIICLVLTLPVSSATTERSFSALKILKTRLRTSMGDPRLVDLVILYIEKEIARKISIDRVVCRLTAMKSRRV